MNPIDDKYKVIWKMLKKYSFNINPVENRDLLCVICNKILINAFQNECGCRFCYKCITSYVENNDKACPGNTEECSKEIIDRNTIQPDFSANKRLSAILVKCPLGTCTYIDSLTNINNHLQSHTLDCPFALFGCCQSKYSADNLQYHLSEYNSIHSKLIFDCINNVKVELKNSQRNEINQIGRQFIELYEIQEIKIGKLELENEDLKKLSEKLGLLELEIEELRKLDKIVEQHKKENAGFKKLIEKVAWLELETEELRKLDKMVAQLQMEYIETRKFQEIITQLHFENTEFGKLDEKVSQLQLEYEKLKLIIENTKNNSKFDQNETQQMVDKISKDCMFELSPALTEIRNDIEDLKTGLKQDQSSIKSSSNQSDVTSNLSVSDRKNTEKYYPQSTSSSSRKLNENDKEKIKKKIFDLEDDINELHRYRKEMKKTLKNCSDDIFQLKNLGKHYIKTDEFELYKDDINDEFQKLKIALDNYILADKSEEKIQNINQELTELKKSRDKIKYGLDKTTIEHRVIKEKLYAQTDKLKTDIEKINETLNIFNKKFDKIDKNVQIAQKELENVTKGTENSKEIEVIKTNCAEFNKIINQSQIDMKSITSNFNDLNRDLMLLTSEYDVTKSTNRVSIEKLQNSQLEIELFINDNINKYIKSFEELTPMNDSIKRLNNELSKLRIDFTFSHKNLISDLENMKSEFGTHRSVDNKLQVQITKLNSETMKISDTLNNNQLKTKELIIAIDEMNLFRSNLETFQSEIAKNREDIKLLKISETKLSEDVCKIIGNVDMMGEFKQSHCNRFNELVASHNESEKRQDDLIKQLNSRFLNLRTECLNIKSDIAAQLTIKKPGNNREWIMDNFSKRLQRSISSEDFHVSSDWFIFTGYKMSFKIYLNGDLSCKNRFMSVFFFIKRLPDFAEENKKYRLTITLVDRLDEKRSINKEYDYYNFIKEEKQLCDSNALGASDFISLDELRGKSRFIQNDSLLFRFIVKSF